MAYNWGTLSGGAMGGAGLGFMLGGPPGAAAGLAMGAIGGGIGGLFGGSKKRQDIDDPLAGIRAQLQSLAAGVPALVERQKGQIGQRYGNLLETGTQEIGEDVYARRGLGRTSIYDRLKTELATKLAQGQSADELAAEMAGLQTQANILGGAGSLAGQEQPEEPSMWANLLGQGAGLGANLLGQNWLNEQSMGRLKGILDKRDYTGEEPVGANIRNILSGTSGVSYYKPEQGMIEEILRNLNQ